MTTRILITLVLVALVVSQLDAALPPDPEATKLLTGNWVVPIEEYTATIKDGGFTFRPDGTFSSFGVFRVHDQDMRIEVEGKWSIKNGVLIEELTKSNQPQMAPVGTLTRDTLLEITDRQYRFRTETGVDHTYFRE
jgi:hypothetical protein